MSMNVKETIEAKLAQALNPQYLQVVNESNNHNVAPGSETHFKVIIVTDAFNGKRSVARHQRVYQELQHELNNGVHALALHTYTEAEWAAREAVTESPACLGGSKEG